MDKSGNPVILTVTCHSQNPLELISRTVQATFCLVFRNGCAATRKKEIVYSRVLVRNKGNILFFVIIIRNLYMYTHTLVLHR
jgi:hypothetical protein